MGPDALDHVRSGFNHAGAEHFPEMPIHLSVQANAVNWATVKPWQQMGLTRVILSRELSLDEIEEIRRQVPERWRSRFSSTARCAWPTPAAACSPGISTSATRTRGPAPTPAAGNTTWRKAKEDDVSNIVHKYEPIPVQTVEPTSSASARRPIKSL